MNTQLIEVLPKELKFEVELKKQSSCSLQLTNITNQYVAFKVKTTSPKKYCVRPNVGIILPNATCEFTVEMQAQKVAPEDMICIDKFLIQCTTVSSGITEKDITSKMFAKDDIKYIQEIKLRVILVGRDEVSETITSNTNTQLLEVLPKDQLEFNFELKKQSSCSVRLTNISDRCVAFKVKTTSLKKYCVCPNMGVILPKSSSEFIVTMQAQKVAPADMMCKDKFLIQCTAVSFGITEKDMISKTFAKAEIKYIQEIKLRVNLVECVEVLEKIKSDMTTQVPQVLPKESKFISQQPQKVAPGDMMCKDKFRMRSTVASFGTTEKDITAETFTEDVTVALISPSQSPVRKDRLIGRIVKFIVNWLSSSVPFYHHHYRQYRRINSSKTE